MVFAEKLFGEILRVKPQKTGIGTHHITGMTLEWHVVEIRSFE
jgi:hypothetical protein